MSTKLNDVPKESTFASTDPNALWMETKTGATAKVLRRKRQDCFANSSPPILVPVGQKAKIVPTEASAPMAESVWSMMKGTYHVRF